MQLSFGETLRQTRKTQKLTIKQLAKFVGCSTSYISQLENGTTKPSVTMLRKLAESLNKQITDFFRDNQETVGESSYSVNSDQTSGYHNCLITEKQRREIIYPDGKTKSQFLTSAVYQKKMQPILTIIEPGGVSHSDDNITHPVGSEEFFFVLNGEIDFEINNQEFKLKTGDTFYFDGNIPHRWTNNSDKVAEILFVWTPAVW